MSELRAGVLPELPEKCMSSKDRDHKSYLVRLQNAPYPSHLLYMFKIIRYLDSAIVHRNTTIYTLLYFDRPFDVYSVRRLVL